MINELNNYISNLDFDSIDKHPNILIAARIWDERRYNAAKVCYKFMRMIDDHIDNRKAGEEAITCMEREMMTDQVNNWIDCLYKIDHQDSFFKELVDTISTFHIPLKLFHNFTKSMLYDINNDGFSTLEEFMEYAEGASVAPASVFVHLCCLTEKDHTYTPADFDIIDVARPCAIFSYIVHIIRDFQQDQLDNLNYFAADILEKYQLTPGDLKKIASGGPVPDSFRNVIREYRDIALQYGELTQLELNKLSPRLHGRYMLSLHVIYQLYKMVFDRIDVEHGNFTSSELNPTQQEIKNKVLEISSNWSSNSGFF